MSPLPRMGLPPVHGTKRPRTRPALALPEPGIRILIQLVERLGHKGPAVCGLGGEVRREGRPVGKEGVAGAALREEGVELWVGGGEDEVLGEDCREGGFGLGGRGRWGGRRAGRYAVARRGGVRRS
jgi:hypothetical protein